LFLSPIIAALIYNSGIALPTNVYVLSGDRSLCSKLAFFPHLKLAISSSKLLVKIQFFIKKIIAVVLLIIAGALLVAKMFYVLTEHSALIPAGPMLPALSPTTYQIHPLVFTIEIILFLFSLFLIIKRRLAWLVIIFSILIILKLLFVSVIGSPSILPYLIQDVNIILERSYNAFIF